LIRSQLRHTHIEATRSGHFKNGLTALFDTVLVLVAALFLIEAGNELIYARPDFSTVAILTGINGALALLGFVAAMKLGRPIFLVVAFFDYVFFAIAPMHQFRIGEDPIYDDIVLLTYAVLLCLAFSLAMLPFCIRPIRAVKKRLGILDKSLFDTCFCPEIMFAISLSLNLALLIWYAPALFQTRQAMEELIVLDKSSFILVISFLNPFAFISAFLGLLAAYRAASAGWFAAFSVCLMLSAIVNNPSNMARFRVGALYFMVIMALGGWRNTRLLSILLIVGMLISPALNAFRYDDQAPTEVASDNFLTIMDYHIVNLLCYTIKYSTEVGISYGSNLLGSVLFFVPRTTWSGKSEHIGYYLLPFVQESRYYGTDNLASPLLAEGYFAFGVAGAIALPALVFMILSWLERSAVGASQGSAWHFILCVSPTLTMILMRGPLVVGISEFISFSAAVMASCFVLRIGFRAP
jgi:hypothetical protein